MQKCAKIFGDWAGIKNRVAKLYKIGIIMYK